MTNPPHRGQNVVVPKDEKGIVLRPLGTAAIDRRDTFSRYPAGMKKTASETSGRALSVQPGARSVAMRTITIDERDGLAAAVPTDAWPLGTVSRATDPFRPQPFANSLIDAVVRRA
jgi:hypothetical protein